MRTTVVSLLALLLVILIMERLVPGPGDSEKELFVWFDSLSLPDLAKCEVIQVSTGEAVSLPNRTRFQIERGINLMSSLLGIRHWWPL